MSAVNSRNLQKPGPYSSSRLRAVGDAGGWAGLGHPQEGTSGPSPPSQGALTEVFEHMEVLALPKEGQPQNGKLLIVHVYHVDLPVAWEQGEGRDCTRADGCCLAWQTSEVGCRV